MKAEGEAEEFAFVRYMNSVPLLDEEDEALRVLCLQWATAGIAKKGHSTVKEGEDRDALVAGEWLGAIPFRSTVSTVHVFRANTETHPLTTKVPWSTHRFYVGRFVRQISLKRITVHEQNSVFFFY